MQLIILGQLTEKPSHGYAIKQTLDCIIGMRKKISWGSLYPILKKLGKESLIENVKSRQEGGPAQKNYSITLKGRSHFLKLMAQADYAAGDGRVRFRYKLLFFDKVSKEIRIKIINDYKNYCQDNIELVEQHLREIGEQGFSPKKLPYIAEDLKHSLKILELEKTWADKLLAGEQHKKNS